MPSHGHCRDIVHPGALEIAVGKIKTGRLYDVDRKAKAGGEPQDRSGIAGDVGLVEGDAQFVHGPVGGLKPVDRYNGCFYDTEWASDPWPHRLVPGSSIPAAFAATNLCRIGNRPPADEESRMKMGAAIWHGSANRDKARFSSTRTEGGMHDRSDVGTPPTSDTASPGLTGSALVLLLIEHARSGFIRRS